MPFHYPDFVFIFLPLVLAGWLVLVWTNAPKLVLATFLIAVSALFYWQGSPDFFFGLVLLTLVNFFLGWRLAVKPAAWIFWSGIVMNLGLLGWFKYANFAIDNLNAALGLGIPAVNVVLPLAISFFTFQKIAYLTDTWRGDHSRYGLVEFFLLVWFFPQLVAGPIIRPHELIPQWRKMRFSGRRVTVDLTVGFTLFFVGLIKKLVIADQAAIYADYVFDGNAGTDPMLVEAWIGALAYTVQIYFDFSGYSDMAMGLARMFGFRLPINFFSPYRADSIIDFWRRWHITLSRLLRDYLYIPLGGSRLGPVRRYGNLMVVMLIGGLWHGASWTFVLWGGMHGAFLAANHLWRSFALCSVPPILARTMTILAVIFAWVAFRAKDVETATAVWSGMLGLNGINLSRSAQSWLGPILPDSVHYNSVLQPFVALDGPVRIWLVLLGLILAMSTPNIYQWLAHLRPALHLPPASVIGVRFRFGWRPTTWSATALGTAFVLAYVLQGKPQAYLYWQF